MSKFNNMALQNHICSAYLQKTKTTKELQKELKISPNDIYKILKDNNIKLRGNNLSEEKALKICENYKNGQTVKQICFYLKVAESTVLKVLKKNNVQTRKKTGCFKRIYNLDENIFEKIDTFDKAQFLGLVYSDGSLSKYNKNISIRLREDDKKYLNDWRIKFLKSNKPLGYTFTEKIFNTINKKTYKTKYGSLILDISSTKVYNDASSLGLCTNKSKADLPMPKIPHNLKIGFILGLFEGDGCITSTSSAKTRSFSIACQKNMGQDIKKYFDNIGIFSSFYERKYICIVQVRRKEDLKKLYNLLYDNASIVMKRKKEKFKKIISNF